MSTYLLIIIMVGSSIVFGALGNVTAAAGVPTSCLAGLAFLNLDRWKWFKVGGLEAELQERIDEAAATKVELEQVIAKVEALRGEMEKKVKKAESNALTKAIAL